MPDIGACYLEEDVLDLCRTGGGGHASEGLFLSSEKATVAHLSCVVFAGDAARSSLKGRKALHAPKEQTHTHSWTCPRALITADCQPAADTSAKFCVPILTL